MRAIVSVRADFSENAPEIHTETTLSTTIVAPTIITVTTAIARASELVVVVPSQ